MALLMKVRRKVKGNSQRAKQERHLVPDQSFYPGYISLRKEKMFPVVVTFSEFFGPKTNSRRVFLKEAVG